MLAKLTSKNQLTLPKSVTDSLGPVQYFEVQVQAGQVVLTPVRIQRGDAVRAKLAELDLGEDLLAQAMAWAADAPAKGGKGRGAAKTRAVAKAPASGKAAKPAAKVATAVKQAAPKAAKAKVVKPKAASTPKVAAKVAAAKPARKVATSTRRRTAA